MKLPVGKALQIMRTGSAKALGFEPAWCVAGAARGLEQISIRDSQEVWFSAGVV